MRHVYRRRSGPRLVVHSKLPVPFRRSLKTLQCMLERMRKSSRLYRIKFLAHATRALSSATRPRVHSALSRRKRTWDCVRDRNRSTNAAPPIAAVEINIQPRVAGGRKKKKKKRRQRQRRRGRRGRVAKLEQENPTGKTAGRERAGRCAARPERPRARSREELQARAADWQGIGAQRDRNVNENLASGKLALRSARGNSRVHLRQVRIHSPSC